jgi:uncharacterized membrane protein
VDKRSRETLYGRIGIFLVGLGLLSMGVASLAQGQSSYTNYWGGLAFAPIPAIIGILAMAMAIFKKDKSAETPRSKNNGKRNS